MSSNLWRQHLPCLRRLLTRRPDRLSRNGGMGTAAADGAIAVPKRIQRSPTDILQALAGTIGRDTTGPHYKYIDDPYLTPCSNLSKRSYALSRESGRKAARWIREQHPRLFTHRPEDPFIESFHPKARYSEDGEGGDKVSADTLAHLVGRGQVSDAITVYHLCKKNGEELREEVLQAFLELLSFSNSEDPLETEWLEENWYRQSGNAVRKTWKDNGLAEEVFASLPSRGPPAYCALIRGMAQYYQVDRAWQLYLQCQEKGIALDTNTYNSLIKVASYLRDAPDLRWQLVKELLGAMADSGTQPNLGTLNATLQALGQMAAWRQARGLSLRVLAEFHGQGIRPCLATYYHLLTIHCRQRGPLSHILLDILDHIEGQTFTVQDPKDIHFFVTAMEVARNHLQSLEAAHRLNSLLRQGDHRLLIGDSYKESVYYRHYFALSCSMLPMDEFMEVYTELVPHIYTPEPGIMQEVIQAVRISGGLHYIPQLWSDMILFEHSSRDTLVALTLSALAQHQPDPQDEGLTQRLATVTKDIWNRVQGQDPNRRNRVTWTGQMLGEALEVLVRCGEYATAQEVLDEATNAPQAILGVLPPQSLGVLLQAAIERKDAGTAVRVVLYSQDAGHQETGRMSLLVCSSLDLTPQQRAQIDSQVVLETLMPGVKTSSGPAVSEAAPGP